MVLFKKREISRKWDHGSGSSVHGQILKTKKKKKRHVRLLRLPQLHTCMKSCFC